MPNKKKKNKKRKARFMKKRLSIILVGALAGLIGVWLLGQTFAVSQFERDMFNYLRQGVKEYKNPSLSQANACSRGVDIAFAIDGSDSIDSDQFQEMKDAVLGFTDALRGTPTQFSVSSFSNSSQWVHGFTADVDAIQTAVRNMRQISGGTSFYAAFGGAWSTFDPRPAKPNLIILLTDGGASDGHQLIEDIKAAGTRLLGVIVGGETWTVEIMIGPKVNTGNIWTSDVITTDSFRELTATLKTAAAQLCKDAPKDSVKNTDTTGNPHGRQDSGDDGDGGDGGGQSDGQGGSSGGSGGSSANEEDDNPNSLPSDGSHGNKDQPNLEPSPFFDGKLFAAGSDADMGDYEGISIAGRKFGYGWLYLAGGVTVLGALGGGVYWWLKGRK